MDVIGIMHCVREYRLEKGLSKTELAEMAGLSNESTLRNMDSIDWNPRALTLQALFRVLPSKRRARVKQARR